MKQNMNFTREKKLKIIFHLALFCKHFIHGSFPSFLSRNLLLKIFKSEHQSIAIQTYVCFVLIKPKAVLFLAIIKMNVHMFVSVLLQILLDKLESLNILLEY